MGGIVWQLTWASIGISLIWISARMFARWIDGITDRIERARDEEDEDAPDPAEL